MPAPVDPGSTRGRNASSSVGVAFIFATTALPSALAAAAPMAATVLR